MSGLILAGRGPALQGLSVVGIWAAALVAGGCAHGTSAGAPPQKPSASVQAGTPSDAKSDVSVTHLRNADLGATVDVPAGLAFAAGEEASTFARAPDSTELRVFVEHVAGTASSAACWDSLFQRMPAQFTGAPQNSGEFAALAHAGLQRGDHLVYMSIVPQGSDCYVLLVDGPKDSETLKATVPVAQRSFRTGTPSPAVTAEFETETGARYLEAKDYTGALQHFERSLELVPDNLRAQFGAGLAAYFAGPQFSQKAINHLKIVLAGHNGDDDRSEAGAQHSAQVRDALMYIGLAYAQIKDFDHSTASLAELVDRFPDDAIARYNFACVLALSGDSDGAFGELKEALQRDPDLAAHAREDDDLLALRKLSGWPALLGRSEGAKSSTAVH
jgi:tetratricopeptide (TPR) repeat protein